MFFPPERQGRAEQQRRRRMSSRTCGNCGELAEIMLRWAGQTIPICRPCKGRLDAPPIPEPLCSFYEVDSETLRPPDVISPPVLESDQPEDSEQREQSVVGRVTN